MSMIRSIGGRWSKNPSGGADIGAWEFFGPSRVAELTLGNGLICSDLNNDRTRSAAQNGESLAGLGR